MTEVVLDAVNKVYPDGFHAVRDMSMRDLAMVFQNGALYRL